MKNSHVGPRGWAALTLAAGAFVAIPFLRSSRPLLETSVTSEKLVPEIRANGLHDTVEFTGQSEISMTRVVSGQLPSTVLRSSAVKSLPDWAIPASQLDKLIADGPASEERIHLDLSIDAMRTWTGSKTPLRQNLTESLPSEEAAALAFRSSPWEETARETVEYATESQQAFAEPSWPDRQTNDETAHNVNTTTSTQACNLVNGPTGPATLDRSNSRIQATITNAPRDRRFVYQPGL